MTDSPLEAQVAGATAYQALHVPALFAEWPPTVLDAAHVAAGHRVLDVACGTGVLAGAAASRVGSSGSVTGVDPNPGMLTVASQLHSGIDWQYGTAEALPCADSSFDRVVSQFGMMFFADPGLAVEEMLRVLVPGGHLAIAVWDSLESCPAYSRSVGLLDRMAGTAASEALQAPFRMGDRDASHRLFERAGVAGTQAETRVGRARFPSIRSMMEADLRGWLPAMGVDLEEELILRILTEAERELIEFVNTDGRMEFDAPAHIVAGTKAMLQKSEQQRGS